MPSFDFRALGGIELLPYGGGEPPAIVSQPKRIALLAYLALARPRGVQRRDTLLAIFWPESDERRARNALSQSLHVLRSCLGPDAVEGAGSQDVGVSPARVRCDVARFEDLLASGQPADAFDLYRGELLPGLHVPDSPDFAHWLDLERDRLHRMARDSARAAAAEYEDRGSPALAMGVLHRAIELFPEDEDLFLRLVEVMADAGDRAGVMQAWQLFQRRRAHLIGLPPSAKVRERIDRIRRDDRTIRSVPGTVPDAPVRSLAVLPLQRLGSEGDAYSTAGMTEALVAELGRIRSLRVISHQSVLRFQGSTLPLRDIAAKLDVDALVEGSVLEAGGRVRVTAQLVRAEPEEHLWADAFEADAQDVIAVHRDVAKAVAQAVSAALSEEEERELARESKVNPAAYDAYLRGWQKHATALPSEMAKALPLYLEAIRHDPTFAPPRASLVDIYFILMCMGEMPVEGNVDRAFESAELAIALDPHSARGHSALGLARMLRHDWSGAEESLVRATVLGPSLALGHAHLVGFLTGMGRFDEAAAAAERCRRLDPLAPYAHWMVGWTLHYARRAEDSVRALEKMLEHFPSFPNAWTFLAKARYQLGDREGTLNACERAMELMPESPMCLSYVAHIQARLGEADAAERSWQRFLGTGEARGYTDPYYAAAALAGLGREEEALERLDHIRADASSWGWLLAVDPLLDPLRQDRRFDAVLERVGLRESVDQSAHLTPRLPS